MAPTGFAGAQANTRRRRQASLAESDQLLAEVFTLEQADKASRRIVDSLDDRLAVLELAGSVERLQALQRLVVAVLPVEYNHPLHPDALDQHRAQHLVAIRLEIGRAS